MNIEDFYTKPSHETGVKLPLKTPEGKQTEHFLVVKGIYSDSFREARNALARFELTAGKDEKERETLNLKCLCALICDWSFDKDCSEESKLELLRNAPQIADKINLFSAQNKNFTEKK